MSDQYSLVIFIQQIYKWRKQLIRSAVGIFILSAAISLLIPNYYQAETIFYAASPDLAKPIPIGGEEKDVRIYGDDKDLDRLFTIAISQDLLMHLVDSFDLYSHYKIKKSNPKAKFKVRKELLDNYKTIKTKYGALHLIILDKDPEMAASMANAARYKISDIAQKLVKESQWNLIQNFSSNLNTKKVQSDSLASEINRLKQKSGIFEARGQSEIFSRIMLEAETEITEAQGKIEVFKKYPSFRDSLIRYQAIESGAKNKKEKAILELEKYAPVLPSIRRMEQEQSRLNDQMSLDKERLKQLTASYQMPFSALHVVETAEVPVQKVKPKRMLLVLITSIVGIVFAMLAILILENMKSVRF
jgi:capsular polysaccharide biosynthesis protein